ncbi:hypothetical protein ZWY2020_036760 [Hordeum vulgare]|nr:hypothetical protein ZWY2020_036760 [Hordeum vulgare]
MLVPRSAVVLWTSGEAHGTTLCENRPGHGQVGPAQRHPVRNPPPSCEWGARDRGSGATGRRSERKPHRKQRGEVEEDRMGRGMGICSQASAAAADDARQPVAAPLLAAFGFGSADKMDLSAPGHPTPPD